MSNLDDARALHAAGKVSAAEQLCRTALRSSGAHDARWQHLMGLCLLDRGDLAGAGKWLRSALVQLPAGHAINIDLAAALGRMGDHRGAAEACRRVLHVDPADPHALHNLGAAHDSLGEFDEALKTYRAGLAVRPRWVVLRRRIAAVLRRLGRFAEAEHVYRELVAEEPADPTSWSGLAATLEETARSNDAIGCHRRVRDLLPSSPDAHSNLLTALHYSDTVAPDEVHAEHLAWARRFGRTTEALPVRALSGIPNLSGRLRVGYVSPDFRNHAAGRFIEPILANHDRTAVDVFCYSDVRPRHRDAVTRRCQGYGHAWRDVAGLPDERVAQMISQDRIDVLVDLAGHMANPRLTLFGRRMAPVQVTYLGYPSTTGLTTMDYRLTDAFHDPPGLTEQWHAERLVRLDRCCCLCYRPDDNAPAVGPLPALATERVTFAAFNRLAKASTRALILWARVLDAVPGSQLMVKVAAGAEDDNAIKAQFARYGIAGDRLTLVGRLPSSEYMGLWNAADIALDTFPYHGVTTTCEGLWMGVPTVTLAGNTHVSRAGVSLLNAVALDHLVAADDAGYLSAAVGMARDLFSLAELRAGLRLRMRESLLIDGRSLARSVEMAYRAMWREQLCSRK